MTDARTAWLAERRKGLGASDFSAILGLSPWATPYSVWLDKTGKVEAKEETPAMRFGSMLEAGIADMYMAREGRRMTKCLTSIPHPLYPEIRCTPDFIDADDKTAPILEIKYSPYKYAEWGIEGTDDVPQYYLVQCVVMMEVLDRESVDVAVSFGKPEYQLYHVKRDRELGAALIQRGRDWWQRHIVEGVEPPVDGSDAATEYLTRRFAKPKNTLKCAEGEVAAQIKELASVKAQLSELEARENELKNALRAFIGDNLGCEDDNGNRINWTPVKGRTKTDWSAVMAELRKVLPAKYLPLIDGSVQGHTSVGEATRRFELKMKKEI